MDISDGDSMSKSNYKKETDKDENLFKRKKLKKEKRNEDDKMDEDSKKNLEDIKNLTDEEKEKRLLQMKKKLHRELIEKESDKDQDSSFESKDKLKHIKSSSSLSSLQFDSSFIKMAKQVIKKKKRGEELNETELGIYIYIKNIYNICLI